MKKLAIVYGALETALQKRAVEELTKLLLDYVLEYPCALAYREDLDLSDYTPIYIGTAENNPYVRVTSEGKAEAQESYHIRVKDGVAAIEGHDDAGVLYGVLDFYNLYLLSAAHPKGARYPLNPFAKDTLPDFTHASAPAVRERGLWTWGHVIYDYKQYLDNMMRLKMNSVIIWNDFAPVNGREIVAYAHSCGIKVIWGFSWLWNSSHRKVDIQNLEGKSEEILAQYEAEYASLGGDGIYFQTFTEVKGESLDGVFIAEAATAFVNRTAALFYEKYPDLEIQFGLHATSVKERLAYIKTVDPRITIVWEDAGAFPFAYVPTEIEGFEETKTFVGKIARLRGENERFGAVTKGLICLDWRKFSHLRAPHCLGVSLRETKARLAEERRRIWRYVQAYWLSNADKAQEMIKEMARLTEGDLCLFGLVEDGLFEENIPYPVALYGEMLWDAYSDTRKLMTAVALRGYVSFT